MPVPWGLAAAGMGATALGGLLGGGGNEIDYDSLYAQINQMMNSPEYSGASRAGALYSNMMPGMLNAQLPMFSPEVQAQLDQRYNIGAQDLQTNINRQSQSAMGDLSASMTSRGLGRSTAGMMGASQIGDARLDALRQGMAGLEQQRTGDYLGIRQNMMGAQSQRLGTYGSYLGGMAGNRAGMLRSYMDVAGLEQQNNMMQDQSRMGALGDVGGSIPWMYWMSNQG